jgi:phosphate transport system protein
MIFLSATSITQTTLHMPVEPGLEKVLESLLTMASLVENSVRRSLLALRERKPTEASQVFLGESRINELEVGIDEQVVRLLAQAPIAETDLRLLIATLRITNDLERLGDQAVNVAERVVSLGSPAPVIPPRELNRMAEAVEEMVCGSLRALACRRVELAQAVLESDDRVDRYAESLSRLLTEEMERNSRNLSAWLQLLLVSRTLERMADHATNIAEDVIFWLRGLDVRHRLQSLPPEALPL